MAEEDNISLDVEAETSAFSPIINFNNTSEQESFSGPSDMDLPEMNTISVIPNTSLPESVIIEPQDVTKSPDQLPVEVFESAELPERTINIASLPEIDMPENVVTAASDDIKISLPDPQLIENTGTEVLKSDLKPEYSEIISNFSVKMDPEATYEKVTDLEGKINQLDKNMGDLKYPKGNWINNTEKDKYEERPTVEATNLVFDARLRRFGSRPIWT